MGDSNWQSKNIGILTKIVFKFLSVLLLQYLTKILRNMKSLLQTKQRVRNIYVVSIHLDLPHRWRKDYVSKERGSTDILRIPWTENLINEEVFWNF